MSTPAGMQGIIEWFVQDQGAQALGAAAGLDAAAAQAALRAGVPLQLQAVSDYARTPLGAQQVAEAVRIIPDFPTVRAALQAGQGAADLRRAGDRMAPTLLGTQEGDLARRVAQEVGADSGKVHDLFHLTLPLLLGRLGWRDEAALAAWPALAGLGLTGLGHSGLGLAGTGLAGAGLASTAGAVSAASTASFKRDNAAVPPQRYVVTRPAEERRGLRFPWWLLVPLLLLGGCWALLPRDTLPAAGTATPATSAPSAAGSLTISAPAKDSQVSAAGFNLTGTGTPGATYQVYEDGTSLGGFTVGQDGQWTLDVAGPTAGGHTYTVLDEQGQLLGSVPVTVVSSAAGGAACTAEATISLNDNEAVSAPFRFGGQGSGEGYVVTVWRGDKRVGTKRLPLTPDCTWSYRSDPGGRPGQQADIRYEVRPSGAAADTPAQVQVTLKVTGSGSNFNDKGEYVGPQGN